MGSLPPEALSYFLVRRLWSSGLPRNLGHSPVSDPATGDYETGVGSLRTSTQVPSIRTSTIKKVQWNFPAVGGAMAQPATPRSPFKWTATHSCTEELDKLSFICMHLLLSVFCTSPIKQAESDAHLWSQACWALDKANSYERIYNLAVDKSKNTCMICWCSEKESADTCALSHLSMSQHPLQLRQWLLPLLSPHQSL